jgi:hypothetical protein
METVFTKIFIVFVEVGVSIHGHTGEKQIREEGNLPDFSLSQNCCRLGWVGERG